jgi:hypothetical protein
VRNQLRIGFIAGLLALWCIESLAFDLKQLQGSWTVNFEYPLPTRSGSATPPRISLAGRSRFDEVGNAISVISASIDSKIREEYEPIVSYVLAEQAKWSPLGDGKFSVETVRCTLMQTDRLPDQGNIPQMRDMLRKLILESCRSKPETLEVSSVDADARTIIVRQDGVEFAMKRASQSE